MEKRRLGRTGITVTDICMGTMTFGSQNDEAESFAILDRAFEEGIDFFDTAEVYPVPPDRKWVHRTEEIVGRWMQTKPRDAVLVASKIAGPAHGWFVPPIREGHAAMDRRSIRVALEGSLRRLQTDYLDLYQTHWPDPDFGYEEILETLTELQKEGKIRAFGCSNETPWGLMKSLETAGRTAANRYETIQNNFSILNRRFEDGLAEICRREKVSCLPYSPLAGGVCSGKYRHGALPEGARFSHYIKNGAERQKVMARRFVNDRSHATIDQLETLARDLEVPLVALCLAWSKQHDFVASTIVGATSIAQMEEWLPAKDLVLPDDVLKEIDRITQEIPYPMG
jgi:aryl-alcohol dehydrogenase-like predicted oxidoreductase